MYGYYWFFLLIMLVLGGLGASANAKVKNTFSALSRVPARSRMTGYDTATKLLRANDVRDISVHRVGGFLSDHYHPTKKTVNLSESVYGNASVAAVAVAAHEIGHVVQKKRGYALYKLRALLVPITNFGTRLALPLVLLGVTIDLFVANAQSSTGYYIALAGVGLYGLSALFALVTLPVEYDASRRAKKMLVETGVLCQDELPYAEKMLSAAANTYLVSLLVSTVYFLRFFVWVLLLFGGRRRR